jgi:hypothetical protein
MTRLGPSELSANSTNGCDATIAILLGTVSQRAAADDVIGAKLASFAAV